MPRSRRSLREDYRLDAKERYDRYYERRYAGGGIAFVGCILIGLAIGLLYGMPGVGVLIGLGAGFIVMALIRAFMG